MSGKYALIIGNTEHADPGLAQLKAPGMDVREFWRVLDSPDICAFDDVVMLLNEDSYRVAEHIEIVFQRRKPEDLLLLYFSGHGVRDENGELYLAVRNTNRNRLRSTAIKSDFIRGIMDECRSRRQVLILDCCNSGAFAQGTKAEVGGSIGTASAFRGTGYGRVVLTASDSTQFAWEGDRVIGETQNSLFTHFLIKGLEGEADRDGQGRITLDDLYDYAYEQIVNITPHQTPGKWSFRQQGEIVLREHLRIEEVTPLPLPAELLEEIEDRRPYVREATIQRLIKLMNGRNLRLAHSAREALQHMADNDDSRAISQMAFEALEANKQAEAKAVQAEAERLAKQREEAERLARLEAERKAREAEADRLARIGSVTDHPEKEKATRAVEMPSRTNIPALLAALTAKTPAARAVTFGLAAVTVIAIAWFAVRAFSNPGTTPDTETPFVLSTNTPGTELATEPPSMPTSEGLVAVTGPAMEVGSSYSYVDGTVLVAVPAGEFSMGGDGTDNPEHLVTLNDYWIYSTEVTNQQYALCVSLGKCSAPDPDSNPGYEENQTANDPVTGVTYNQAVSYCKFVHGRLPTEAEWEKAAQSSQGGKYPWGDAAPTCDLLNFNNCIEGMTNVVRHWRGASFYGALDMAGNVFEWVADWYSPSYYASSPAENPPGPTAGTIRSVRSSSYTSEADQVAVATRNAESPQSQRADLGFRCVVDDPTYFAPFCEAPLVYANASVQDGSLESCPALEIKPVPYCNNGIALSNVTFVGPEEATIDPKDCLPSSNPNLYTCKAKGTVVSISAACELNKPGEASCPAGYTAQGNVCIANGEENQTAENCLTGNYNSSQQCCALPSGGKDIAQTCPVGTFYAANAKACFSQPVQELITVSFEVNLPGSCASTGGGGGGGGGTGGCPSEPCPEFYSWDSASCSCKPD